MLRFHRKTVLLLLAGLVSDQQYCRAFQAGEKYHTLILDPSIPEDIKHVIKNGHPSTKYETNNGVKIIYNDYSMNRNIPSISLKQINNFVSNVFYFTSVEEMSALPGFTFSTGKRYSFQEIPSNAREYIKNSLVKSFFTSVLTNKIVNLNRIIQILVNREGQFRVIEIDENNIFYVLEGPFGPNKWTWEFIFHRDFRFQVGGMSLAISENPLIIGAFPKNEGEIKQIFSNFANKKKENTHINVNRNLDFVTLGSIFNYISNIEGIEYVVNDSISKYKIQISEMEKADTSEIKNSLIKLFGISMINSPDKKKVFVSFKRLMQLNITNSKSAIRNYLPPQVGRFYKDNNLHYRKIKGIKDNIPDQETSAKAVMKMFDCVRDEVLEGLDSIKNNKNTIPLKELDDDLMSRIGLLFLCTVDVLVRGIGIEFPRWADKIDECMFEKLSEENNIMNIGIYHKENLVYIIKFKTR